MTGEGHHLGADGVEAAGLASMASAAVYEDTTWRNLITDQIIQTWTTMDEFHMYCMDWQVKM